jgi:hypothetical protein
VGRDRYWVIFVIDPRVSAHSFSIIINGSSCYRMSFSCQACNATLVIGTKSAAGIEDFARNAANAQGVLGTLTAEASTRVEAFSGSGRILTDDCAPVERLMDLMILRVIQKTARDKT